MIKKACDIKSQNDHMQERWLIWHQAALMRAKKLPDLRDFMKPLKPAKKTGIDETDIKMRLRAYQNGQGS